MSKKLRKPLSIILSIMMILSVFTIIPLTANAADVCPYCGSTDIKWDDLIDIWVCYNCSGEFETPAQSSGGHSGITVTCVPEEGGSVDVVDYGDGGWFITAYPSPGYVFVHFVQDGYTYRRHYMLFDECDGAVTAIFAPIYTVTWKNGDTVLETDTNVAKDAAPEYNGKVPTKAEDDSCTYTFAGWTDGTNTYGLTDTLPNVTADVTYTAVFEGTMKPEAAVAAMINALPPTEVTVNDKEAIEAARAAYDALTDDQQALVSGGTFAKLMAAERALAAAEQAAADQAAADEAAATINALPAEITAADKDAVEAARAAYDALTDVQKALVDADTLAKLTAAEEALIPPVVNESYVKNETVKSGNAIRIIGAAKDGTAPYTYAYYFKRTGNTAWKVVGTEFGTATSVKLVPTSAGTFEIKIIVKDAKGKTDEKLLTAEAVGSLPLDSGASLSASVIQPGESVTIKANPTGGTTPYTCEFYYKKSYNTTWKTLKAGKRSATLTPQSAGYYDIKCVVTDADGVTAEKVLQVNVEGDIPFINLSKINKSKTVPVNTAIKITGDSNGGKSPVTYEYFFKRSTNTNWKTLKAASADGTYAKFTPTAAAEYEIKVVATDSEGTKAEKIITVTAVSDT